jgi:hypothetical protein
MRQWSSAEGEGEIMSRHRKRASGFALTLLGVFVVTLTSAIAQNAGVTYTLYRTSPGDASMRIHVATFNADEPESYNRENCQVAARLFAAQPNVTVRYFCEKGPYRP